MWYNRSINTTYVVFMERLCEEMKKNNIKKIFLSKGCLECADYYKDKFNKELEYTSNSYKKILEEFKNPQKALSLIDQNLFAEQEMEIEKYNNLINEFISKLYKIPERSISNIIFRVVGAAFCFSVSQSVKKASISFPYLLLSIIILIFMIIRLVKTYGNKLYNELDLLF